jgi:1-acyl-sn-glycerol-3-phosphate acyltransferase
MIEARHKPFWLKFFDIYTAYMLKKHFYKVDIQGHIESNEHAVLIIGNHFSWWDGFFTYYLNRKTFRKKFHVMMLEEQLAPRPFLNKIGAFSIKKNMPSLMESLNYAASLLRSPEHLLLMFPQGEIQSMHTQKLLFEKGILSILKKAESPVDMYFMSNLIDYFSRKKPSLNIYLKKASTADYQNISELQQAYNDFYLDCISKQKE